MPRPSPTAPRRAQRPGEEPTPVRLRRPSPGRPRSPAAHEAILNASIALTREVGYDAVTMDAIALRAGVGKATVYRRWRSKDTLVAEAVERIIRSLPVPDTGHVRSDLIAVLRTQLGLYRDPASAGLLASLVAAMARSQAIAAVVRNGFHAVRRDAVRQVLQRGIRRGKLRRGLDLELAVDLLNAPLFYRLMVTGAPIDEPLVDALVGLVLEGLVRARKA